MTCFDQRYWDSKLLIAAPNPLGSGLFMALLAGFPRTPKAIAPQPQDE
jgi:hypothetical protein